MKITIKTPVKFEGVHYAAGSANLEFFIAQRMINGGHAVSNEPIKNTPNDVIRSAIESAIGNNALELAPYAPAPTYAASTIYAGGSIVRGNGANAANLYYMGGNPTNTNNRGTSGAASAPTGITNSGQVDGTCVWYYIGKTSASGTYPLYSTVTPAAATDVMDGYIAFLATTTNAILTTLGLTRKYDNNRTGSGAGPFARMGGFIRYLQSQTYADTLSNWGGTLAVGNYSGSRAFMEFTTSAQQWIGLQPASTINGNYSTEPGGQIDSFDIMVNGVFLSEAPLTFNNLAVAGGATPGNAATTFLLDLTKFGNGNKTIRIIPKVGVYASKAPFSVFVKDSEAVWATAPATDLKVSCEGGSLMQGGFIDQINGRDWIEHQIMNLLGFNNCINVAIGATSASNISNNGKTAATQSSPSLVNTCYSERIRFIEESGEPDIHIVEFHNEISNSTEPNLSASNEAIYNYLVEFRATFPKALIVVANHFALANEPTNVGATSLLALENRVKAQVDRLNDSNLLFIPVQSAAFPFFNGTTMAGTSWYHSNGGSGVYGNSHFVNRAQRVVAQHITEAIRRYYQTK
jgi:hypothetical protein